MSHFAKQFTTDLLLTPQRYDTNCCPCFQMAEPRPREVAGQRQSQDTPGPVDSGAGRSHSAPWPHWALLSIQSTVG